jgi:hypothetical protein
MFQNAQPRDRVIRRTCWAALTALLVVASAAPAAGTWSALLDPDNSLAFSFRHAGRPAFRVALAGWGPGGPGSGCRPGRRPRADGSRPAPPSS